MLDFFRLFGGGLLLLWWRFIFDWPWSFHLLIIVVALSWGTIIPWTTNGVSPTLLFFSIDVAYNCPACSDKVPSVSLYGRFGLKLLVCSGVINGHALLAFGS